MPVGVGEKKAGMLVVVVVVLTVVVDGCAVRMRLQLELVVNSFNSGKSDSQEHWQLWVVAEDAAAGKPLCKHESTRDSTQAAR